MKIERILQELHQRRKAIEDAIRAFERLSGRLPGRASPPVPGRRSRPLIGPTAPQARRGRRPILRPELLPSPAPLLPERRRKRFSAATIERMRAAHRARWQKIRSGEIENPYHKRAALAKAADSSA